MNLPDDPYTPPVADEFPSLPDAPLSCGWEVRDGRLWVEDQAVLPMIDPYTGATAEKMTLVSMAFRASPWWFWLLPLLAAIGGAWLTQDTEARIGAAWGGGGGLVFCWLSERFYRRCRVNLFLLPTTWLSRRILCGIMQVLLILTTLTATRTDLSEPQAWWPVAVCGGTLLILFLQTTFLQRRLTCRRVKGQWFEIRGVHPLALMHLIIHRAKSASSR